jgi:hypothetical protein
MKEPRRIGKPIGKRDWAKVAANRKAIAEALVRNLNANVLKEEAEHSSNPPEGINKNGEKSE